MACPRGCEGLGGTVPARSTHYRSKYKNTSYSRFLVMGQAFSLLLPLFSIAYIITNLRTTAADQVFPMTIEQPVLLLIPDFTFCSIFTKLQPMEVVKLFAWFPEGITRQHRCFLRCLLRKWGLFIDAIGRKWDTVEVSKRLLSISSEWRRNVEASSAIYLCKMRHHNMTTKYGCKNAFNFFYCLYNHGMSFLLTEKDISDYRAVYEAKHPYPPVMLYDEYYEDDDSESSESADGEPSGMNNKEMNVTIDRDDEGSGESDYDLSDETTLASRRGVNDRKTTTLRIFLQTRNDDEFTGKNQKDTVEETGGLDDYNERKRDKKLRSRGFHSHRKRPRARNNTRTAEIKDSDQLSSQFNGTKGGILNHSSRFPEQANHSVDHNSTLDYSPSTAGMHSTSMDTTVSKNQGLVRDTPATPGSNTEETGHSVESNETHGQSRSTLNGTVLTGPSDQNRNDSVTDAGSKLEDTQGGKSVDSQQTKSTKPLVTFAAGDTSSNAEDAHNESFAADMNSDLNYTHPNCTGNLIEDGNVTGQPTRLTTPIVASNLTDFQTLNSTGDNSTSNVLNLASPKRQKARTKQPLTRRSRKRPVNATINGSNRYKRSMSAIYNSSQSNV